VGRTSKENRIVEFAKCIKDPSYYAETFCQTFDMTKDKNVPFKMFRRQRELVQNCINNRYNIIKKPRQAGVTTSISLFAACYMMFQEKRKVMIVANKQDMAFEMLKKIKEFIHFAPSWMGINLTRIAQGILELNNGSLVKAFATSEDALRGFTPTLLIIDEASNIRDGAEFWGAAHPSLASGGKCIICSTPRGMDEFYWAIYDAALNNKSNFYINEFKWYEDPRYNDKLKWTKGDLIIDTWLKTKVKDEDYEVFERLEEKGFEPTSPWFEDQCRELNYDKRRISQELLGKFIGSGDNVIDEKDINFQEKENVMPPIRSEGFDGNVWIWKDPIPDHQYILGCLPPGEKVLTNEGLKNIEDIKIDNLLIDENGNFTKIKNIQTTKNINDELYEFKLSNVCRKTIFTRNHPILSSINTELKRNWKRKHPEHKFGKRYWDFNFNFINSENLKINDWIKYPNLYYNKDLTDNEILSKWDKYKNIGRTDFKIKNPLLEKDFWWYVGIWLAEGWYLKSKAVEKSKGLSTCHNINEKIFAYKIKFLCEKIFNRKVNIRDRESVVYTQFNSLQLYSFFLDNFSEYAHNKKLPEWVKYLPKKYKIEILKGYFDGDGCWSKTYKNNKGFSFIAFVSVSLELLEGIQDLLFSLGIISALKILRKGGFCIIENRKFKTKITYDLTLAHYDSLQLVNMFNIKKYNHVNINDFEIRNERIISGTLISKDNKWIYHKIKEINKIPYNGDVYNFETESHTFLCKNITTHNCDVSRGDSSDFSTICIIDLHAGEQVVEYQGKITPDFFGELIYDYANKYQAYTIIDVTGGMGVAPILKLIDMGFDKKLLHYDNPKSRLIQEKLGRFKKGDKLPGFNIGANRNMTIMEFERQVRMGEIKIRSKRLINEMKTFIWKNVGPNVSRPDHISGKNDDLIWSISMPLFISQTTFKNLKRYNEQTKAMLSSMTSDSNQYKDTITPQTGYMGRNDTKWAYQEYGWLFKK